MDPPYNRGTRFLIQNPNFDEDPDDLSISQNELRKLSFSDTRRIAAFRSQQRLREMLQKQEAMIKKGCWKLSDDQHSSLMPTLTYQHILALQAIWGQVVKLVHFSGVHLIQYLQRHCRSVQSSLARGRDARCHARPRFGPREELVRQRRAGRVLVCHITELLANLQHRDTLAALVGRKLDLLLHMGFRPDDVQDLAVKVVTYLQHHHCSHWNRLVEHALNIVLKSLRSLGNEHLARKTSCGEKFQDPISIVHKPRSSI